MMSPIRLDPVSPESLVSVGGCGGGGRAVVPPDLVDGSGPAAAALLAVPRP